LFNKLLEAHGKRCEILRAQYSLPASRAVGSLMDVTPAGARDGRKMCTDVEMQNSSHGLAWLPSGAGILSLLCLFIFITTRSPVANFHQL